VDISEQTRKFVFLHGECSIKVFEVQTALLEYLNLKHLWVRVAYNLYSKYTFSDNIFEKDGL